MTLYDSKIGTAAFRETVLHDAPVDRVWPSSNYRHRYEPEIATPLGIRERSTGIESEGVRWAARGRRVRPRDTLIIQPQHSANGCLSTALMGIVTGSAGAKA